MNRELLERPQLPEVNEAGARASASTSAWEQMQGVWGRGHLPAPARKELMQGVLGRVNLPAPAHQEQMQGVRGREQG